MKLVQYLDVLQSLDAFENYQEPPMHAKIMVFESLKKGYYVMYKLGFKRDNWFLIEVFFGGVLSLALVERYPLRSKLALPCIRLFT